MVSDSSANRFIAIGESNSIKRVDVSVDNELIVIIETNMKSF